MFGIRQMAQLVNTLRETFERPEREFHFVGHQANLRMLEAVCQRCAIPEERHHYNVDEYGNTAGASSASVLSMRWEKWGRGDDVAVAGVGAGLSWAGYWLRFEDPA
jgi:3-oxoacyl-[acyl-carrier-protein] synthase-3